MLDFLFQSTTGLYKSHDQWHRGKVSPVAWSYLCFFAVPAAGVGVLHRVCRVGIAETNVGAGLEGRRGRTLPGVLLGRGGVAERVMTALLLPPPQPPVSPAHVSLRCH